jgi:hypothetical protein
MILKEKKAIRKTFESNAVFALISEGDCFLAMPFTDALLSE